MKIYTMINWEEIPVFISSTFNDMHAERDYLVKNVFPELAEWCERRKLRLIDIDLRWGITSEDTSSKNVVKKCLAGIDEKRSIFLCFLGQRRGWVPNDPVRLAHEKKYGTGGRGNDELGDTAKWYDDRKAAAIYGKEKFFGVESVTEIEIEHALLSPMYRFFDGNQPKPYDHTLFFFRDEPVDANWDATHCKLYRNDGVLDDGGDIRQTDEKLDSFKAEVRNRTHVISYGCRWDVTKDTPELLPSEKYDNEPTPEYLKKREEKRRQSIGRLVDFTVPWENISKAAIEEQLEDIYREKGEEVAFKNLRSIPLKYVIIAWLRSEIIAKTGRKTAVTDSSDRYALDLEQQDIFIHNTCEGFVAVHDAHEKLNNYIASKGLNKTLLLTAEAGLGKSTLLAQWVTEKRDNGHAVIARFCGTSDLASEPYSLWDSICHERAIKTPDTIDELRQNFKNLLQSLSAAGKVVIVIDAIDQLPEGVQMLSWIPPALPDNVKFIISLKLPAEKPLEIDKTRFETIPLIPIDNDSKRALISKYLAKNLKELDKTHIDFICGEYPVNEKREKTSANPLYLKILVSELRQFGAFEQLGEHIERFGETPVEAFSNVLDKLESEQAFDVLDPSRSVPFLFGLLSCARRGLSEDEMARCFFYQFGIDSPVYDTIRFLLRRVRPFMARRNGRADFLYDEFRKAALAKYGKIDNWHLLLSDALYVSRPGECAWHTRMSGHQEKLKQLYVDIDFLCRYYLSDGAFHLKAEITNVDDGIIPPYMQSFMNDTALILQHHPAIAPETFYKELPESYKQQTITLCRTPWLQMSSRKVKMQVEEATSVKPASIQEEGIKQGCFADNSKEAFFLVTADTVKIVNAITLQTISVFNIPVSDDIFNLFCNPNGRYLVAASRESLSVLELVREENGGVIACYKLMEKPCRRKERWVSPPVFVSNNTLVYQTTDGLVYAVELTSAFPEKQVARSDDYLNGYFNDCDDYFVFKTSSGYSIYNDDFTAHIEIKSPVNKLLCHKDSVYIFPDENKIIVCERCTFTAQKHINTSFVTQSAVLFENGLLIAENNTGNLYSWDFDAGFKNHGLLSVDRWDRDARLFFVSNHKAFFFSMSRYALVESTTATKSTILKSKETDGITEVLLIGSGGQFVVHTRTHSHKIENIFKDNFYGLTATLNFKCDWNPDGDILYMGDGQNAIFVAANGTQHPISAPNEAANIVDILWLTHIKAFMMLYRGGQVRLIAHGNVLLSTETFQSSTGNYLTCDCGAYFCIVTKRRLVRQVTVFEETAVSIFDKQGKIVYEEHYRDVDQLVVQNMAYDAAADKLYLLSHLEAQIIDFQHRFSSQKRTFDFRFYTDSIGIAAHEHIIYFAQADKGLCAIDIRTGKMIKNLPSHRSITTVLPAAQGALAIENNELIYSVKLNKQLSC